MNWSEIPGLSQTHMEDWIQRMSNPEHAVQSHGLIPRMKPAFVSCGFEEGVLEIAFPVLEWELNSRGILHGGVVSAALDTALGMLCHYYTYPQVLTTVTMNTTFLKPILPGDAFHIRARMSSLGQSLVTVTGEIRTERENTLAAICTATYKVMHHKVRQAKEK